MKRPLPRHLITCCGAYGGTCARYSGYTAFRDAVAVVAEIVDSHGYQYWLPPLVKDFNFVEFRKGLDFFKNEDTWLVCKECCKGGHGGPPDCVRDCCIKHEVDVCFDCSQFPCDKVKGDANMMKRAKEYTRLGREGWLRRQITKANQGFELHTQKYYQVRIQKRPSSFTRKSKHV